MAVGPLLLIIAIEIIALALQPSLVNRFLPAKAEAYREVLAAGIQLLRILLAILGPFLFFYVRAFRRTAGSPAPLVFQPSRDLPCIAALILCALALRLPALGYDLWWDEMVTVEALVKRGPLISAAFSNQANNHPLNSILAAFMWKLGLHAPALLRLPSLILGVLLAPVAYLGLRQWLPLPVAFLAGAFLAVHFRCLVTAVELRGYSGTLFGALLAMLLFALILDRDRFDLRYAFLGAACLCGFYFPLGWLIIGGLLPLIWLRRSSAVPLACVVVSGVFAALLPIAVQLPQVLNYGTGTAQRSHAPLSGELLLAILQYVTGVRQPALAAVVVLLACAGLLLLARQHAALCAVLTVPALALAAALTVAGSASPRLFIYIVPAVCLGLAVAGHRFLQWTRQPVLIGIVLFGASQSAYLVRYYGKPTPPLGALQSQLGSATTLAGDMIGAAHFYFDSAPVYEPLQRFEQEATPAQRNQYILTSTNCENPPTALLRGGYRVVRELRDWSSEEFWTERRPCYSILARGSAPP